MADSSVMQDVNLSALGRYINITINLIFFFKFSDL